MPIINPLVLPAIFILYWGLLLYNIFFCGPF
jgi:hypothetical protein